MVAVSVVCADTDEHARWIAAPNGLSFLQLRKGRPGPLPSPQEAADYPYTDLEREIVRDRMESAVVGSPDTVAEGLTALLDATEANELMITTMVHDHADRLRSYELVAKLR